MEKMKIKLNDDNVITFEGERLNFAILDDPLYKIIDLSNGQLLGVFNKNNIVGIVKEIDNGSTV